MENKDSNKNNSNDQNKGSGLHLGLDFSSQHKPKNKSRFENDLLEAIYTSIGKHAVTGEKSTFHVFVDSVEWLNGSVRPTILNLMRKVGFGEDIYKRKSVTMQRGSS